MPSGVQVFNPSGQKIFDSNEDIAGRVVGFEYAAPGAGSVSYVPTATRTLFVRFFGVDYGNLAYWNFNPSTNAIEFFVNGGDGYIMWGEI